MSTGKLQVGIIGIGWYALSTHVPNLRSTGKAEVAAANGRNPERLAMAREVLGVDAAFTYSAGITGQVVQVQSVGAAEVHR
jgi:predicted dehydrogenase